MSFSCYHDVTSIWICPANLLEEVQSGLPDLSIKGLEARERLSRGRNNSTLLPMKIYGSIMCDKFDGNIHKQTEPYRHCT